MSSKIDPAKMNRIQRGQPKVLEDLPDNIQFVLKSIYSTCWWPIWLYGSYAKWDWEIDSDLDIWVKNARVYINIIRNIASYHNIRIDCNEYNKDYHLTIIQ